MSLIEFHLQIPSANLTLIHEPCLPGYILEGDRCECREGTNTVLFCLPDQRGVLLAVSVTVYLLTCVSVCRKLYEGKILEIQQLTLTQDDLYLHVHKCTILIFVEPLFSHTQG